MIYSSEVAASPLCLRGFVMGLPAIQWTIATRTSMTSGLTWRSGRPNVQWQTASSGTRLGKLSSTLKDSAAKESPMNLWWFRDSRLFC